MVLSAKKILMKSIGNDRMHVAYGIIRRYIFTKDSLLPSRRRLVLILFPGSQNSRLSFPMTV